MEINKTMGINIDLHRSHDMVKRQKAIVFAFFLYGKRYNVKNFLYICILELTLLKLRDYETLIT